MQGKIHNKLDVVQPVILALCVLAFVGCALVSLLVTEPSRIDLERWELGGAIAASLLWISAAAVALFAVRRWWRHRRDDDWEVVSAAGHWAAMSLARLAGKTLLAGAVIGLWAANNKSVFVWLIRDHPLTIFMSAVCSLIIFTLYDVGEIVWNFIFRRKTSGE